MPVDRDEGRIESDHRRDFPKYFSYPNARSRRLLTLARREAPVPHLMRSNLGPTVRRRTPAFGSASQTDAATISRFERAALGDNQLRCALRTTAGKHAPASAKPLPRHMVRAMWSVWIRRLSFFRSPFSAWILAAAGILLGGCATPFPVATTNYRHPDGRDGAAVLATTLVAHGGDLRARGGDIAAAVTGEWSALITRIQPLVTDHRWRIDAQERLLPAEGLHAIR